MPRSSLHPLFTCTSVPADTVREEEGAVMTIAMTPAGPPADPAVSWRALESGVWVARRAGRHLGSVQRGRRWSAADGDGEVIGAFRTFGEAQAAVADPEAHRTRAVGTAGTSGAAPVVAFTAFAVAALVSASGWALTSLLA
jgi:hypothetical protein